MGVARDSVGGWGVARDSVGSFGDRMADGGEIFILLAMCLLFSF